MFHGLYQADSGSIHCGGGKPFIYACDFHVIRDGESCRIIWILCMLFNIFCTLFNMLSLSPVVFIVPCVFDNTINKTVQME